MQVIEKLRVFTNISHHFAETTMTLTVKNTGGSEQEIGFDMTLHKHEYIIDVILELDGQTWTSEIKQREGAAGQEPLDIKNSAVHLDLAPRYGYAQFFQMSVRVPASSRVSFNVTSFRLMEQFRDKFTYEGYVSFEHSVENFKVEAECECCTDLELNNLHPDLEQYEGKNIQDLNKDGAKTSSDFPLTWDRDRNSVGKHDTLRWAFTYKTGKHKSTGPGFCVGSGEHFAFYVKATSDKIPKDVIFVLDKSGSMYGSKMQKLKYATKNLLLSDSLDTVKNLRLNIVVYGMNVKKMWSGLHVLDDDKYNQVKTFLNRGGPYGFADIKEALSKALDIFNNDRKNLHRPRMIIFLTDGVPSKGVQNINRIVESITNKNKANNVAIFSIAYGNLAKLKLLHNLSEKNYGSVIKIEETSNLEDQIKYAYKEFLRTAVKKIAIRPTEGEVIGLTPPSYEYALANAEYVFAGKVTPTHFKWRKSIEYFNGTVAESATDGLCYSLPGHNSTTLWKYLTLRQKIRLDTDYVDFAKQENFLIPETTLVLTRGKAKMGQIDLDFQRSVSFSFLKPYYRFDPALFTEKRPKSTKRKGKKGKKGGKKNKGKSG